MNPADLENRFTYHPITSAQRSLDHGKVRSNTLELASFYNDRLPEGREKALAMTKLEEAMFWANAAIAREG